MQGKTESLFDTLPWELTKRILLEQALETPKDQVNIALSCSLFNHLTLPEQLVRAIIVGHQDSAEALLKKHPELLLERLTFKDKSGRLFKDTTVWEYVLWALDVCYMAPMMLQCLPHDAKGEAIRIELFKQFEEVETKGVTYELDGVTHTESHYNFGIIVALRNYIDNYPSDFVARGKAWRTIVGGAQWLAPAHVAQHYCELDGNFDEAIFIKKAWVRTLKFFNWVTNELEYWFSPRSESSGLGVSFAIGSAPQEEGGAYGWAVWTAEACKIDLDAMVVLQQKRNEDLDLLKQELQKPLHPVQLPITEDSLTSSLQV